MPARYGRALQCFGQTSPTTDSLRHVETRFGTATGGETYCGDLRHHDLNLRYWNQEDGEHSWPNRRDSVARLIAEKNPLVAGTQEGLYPMLCDLDARLPSYERIGQGRKSPDWELQPSNIVRI